MPKISALSTGTAPAGTESVPAVQSNTTVKVTVDQIGERGLHQIGALTAGTALTGTEVFPAAQGASTVKISANQFVALTALSIRERLTANRTYYVRTDGSDSNTGLSDTAGGAFLTITYALSIVNGLDVNGFRPTIQVRAGTYTESVLNLLPITGVATPNHPSDLPQLLGDTAAPSNVNIPNGIFAIGAKSEWYVDGFRIANPSGGVCIEGHAQAWLRLGHIEFGAATVHMRAGYSGRIELQTTYSITGAAAYHALCQHQSLILNTGNMCTVTGVLNFSVQFAYCSDQALQEWLTGAGFTGGTVTGTRYTVERGSGILVNGAGVNFFPGDVAGTAVAGTFGWYV